MAEVVTPPCDGGAVGTVPLEESEAHLETLQTEVTATRKITF